MCTSFCASPSSKRPAGIPVHLLTSLAMSSSSTSSFSMGESFCTDANRSSAFFSSLLRRGDLAVAYFRDLSQLAGPLEFLFFRFELFDLLFELADFSDCFFLRLPARFPPARILFQFRQLFFDLIAPFFRMRIFLFQQRLPLDFQLQDAPLDLIDLYRAANRSACAGSPPPRRSSRLLCPAENGRKCSDATASLPPVWLRP